jgi:hypothetical protein
MARLDLAIEHGQPMDVAQSRFRAAIREAQERFGTWIHRVDWSEDARAATISGSGYEVTLWFDERDVHAQGRIPLAWKPFEGVVRSYVKKVIERAS